MNSSITFNFDPSDLFVFIVDKSFIMDLFPDFIEYKEDRNINIKLHANQSRICWNKICHKFISEIE